jgi:hypothetical protein
VFAKAASSEKIAFSPARLSWHSYLLDKNLGFPVDKTSTLSTLDTSSELHTFQLPGRSFPFSAN